MMLMRRMDDALDRRAGVIGDVRSREFCARLGEYARDVEGDVSGADHCRVSDIEIGRKAGEIGMAVIPAHEGRRADYARQVGAGRLERPVARRSDGQHDRIIKIAQFVDRDVRADIHIAEKTNLFGTGEFFKRRGYAFGVLMIRRDAGADETIGRGQTIDDVDTRALR